MRRREFITLLGGTAAWPVAARAQQPVMPVVSFVSGRSPEVSARNAASFRKGLNETGYKAGRRTPRSSPPATDYRLA
jgi:putative tryptophan/tyrosine transport system substrate-binding protein